MLVVVDMQEQTFDSKSENFIPEAATIVQPIVERLKVAEEKDELILFTQDIPLESDPMQPELQIYKEFLPYTKHAEIMKKEYYAPAPADLIALRDRHFTGADAGEIEVVGVETSICVLATIMGLLSIFPEADFIIHRERVASKEHEEMALTLLEGMNVVIK